MVRHSDYQSQTEYRKDEFEELRRRNLARRMNLANIKGMYDFDVDFLGAGLLEEVLRAYLN